MADQIAHAHRADVFVSSLQSQATRSGPQRETLCYAQVTQVCLERKLQLAPGFINRIGKGVIAEVCCGPDAFLVPEPAGILRPQAVVLIEMIGSSPFIDVAHHSAAGAWQEGNPHQIVLEEHLLLLLHGPSGDDDLGPVQAGLFLPRAGNNGAGSDSDYRNKKHHCVTESPAIVHNSLAIEKIIA